MDDLHKQYLKALKLLPIETVERIKELEGISVKDHAKLILLETLEAEPEMINERIINWMDWLDRAGDPPPPKKKRRRKKGKS